jgi:IS5 family transposase
MLKANAIKTDLFAREQHIDKLNKIGDPLQDIEHYIDIGALATRVERTVAREEPGSKGGRPPFPTETMIRILLIKRLYGLSDEQTEYQILDRMSYQRFCGLSNASNIPDRTTIWNFEQRIGQEGAQALFTGMQEQLSRHGYMARGGQIVDATLVAAPKQRIKGEEQQSLAQGVTPAHWNKAKRAQKDTDASWVKKHGRSSFGYKLSINVDNKYKVIRQLKTDTAKVHDSQHTQALLDKTNTSADFYADSGYSSKHTEKRGSKSKSYITTYKEKAYVTKNSRPPNKNVTTV